MHITLKLPTGTQLGNKVQNIIKKTMGNFVQGQKSKTTIICFDVPSFRVSRTSEILFQSCLKSNS